MSKKPFPNIDLDGHDFPPSPAPSSPRPGRKYALATELVYTESNDQYNASSMPIYQSATFKQTSGSGGGEYDYTRSGNPTRTHLERHLAKIMSASRALVVSSGMGALDVVTRLLRPGDEVVTGDDLYGGTNRLLKYLATNNGITVHHVDTTNPESVRAAINTKTALVLLETPTNPLIKIVDIPAIATAVHAANPGALVVVDNTMLSPMLMNPLDLGADIVYESATKYLCGHHDVMAGVLAVKDETIGDKLFFTINATGCGLPPNECFLLMRGIKTLAIRMEKQQSNAQAVAEFLEAHGFRVRFPGLKSHPQHALHWSMARGAGAVLSFETGNVDVSERIVGSTKIWGISVSFGCVNSLISMPCRMSHASIDAKTRAERHMPEDIVRLCVGIEDISDLIDDLQTALVQAGAVRITADGFEAWGTGQTVAGGVQVKTDEEPVVDAPEVGAGAS
ncbi:cystathionine beta-lyase [Cryomyces antarcticus]|uniref:cysteine-S-conjugate beta-lyase n=1 Tax=Cryomyces antarcticus TaxID=329879 RepID=A0ABR0LYX9_9PEZI|nr:cystathionine beta-lyase [Cryomyces antarcticus]KAK5256971.1 cystathionine beta-lyase [Cryomyces antarcticus]